MSLSFSEARLLRSLADRAAIEDLGARQRRAFESGDEDRWLDTFVASATLAVGGESASGHAQLRDWFRGQAHDVIVVGADAVIHADGPHATQDSRYVALRGGPPPSPIATGIVRDELVYERGAWYFSSRVVTDG